MLDGEDGKVFRKTFSLDFVSSEQSKIHSRNFLQWWKKNDKSIFWKIKSARFVQVYTNLNNFDSWKSRLSSWIYIYESKEFA